MPEEGSYRIFCQYCGGKLKVRADWAGRKARCPKCQASIVVPPPASAARDRAPGDAAAPPPPPRAARPPGPRAASPGPPAAPRLGGRARGRVGPPPTSITAARVICYIEGALGVVVSLALAAVLALAGREAEGPVMLVIFVGLLLAVIGTILYFSAAGALVHGRRGLATFLAVIGLISIPIGTIIGIIILVCIYNAEASAWCNAQRRRW